MCSHISLFFYFYVSFSVSFLASFFLTLNSRFFFSALSTDSSTIPPSFLGISVFLEIAKLAFHSILSSSPSSTTSSSTFHSGPDLPPQQLTETLCLHFSHTNAGTLCFSLSTEISDKSSTGVTNTQNETGDILLRHM